MSFAKPLSAALTAVSALAAAGTASAERLNFYTTQSSTTLPQVQGLQKRADEASGATSGDLDISVLLAGTLQISAADTTNAVASNIVQMADDLFFSGIAPIVFGVTTVLFIELALITPPMGLSLFIIQGISNGKLSDVIRGVLPFAALIVGFAILLVAWPQIVLWLPQAFAR